MRFQFTRRRLLEHKTRASAKRRSGVKTRTVAFHLDSARAPLSGNIESSTGGLRCSEERPALA